LAHSVILEAVSNPIAEQPDASAFRLI
jgi:hypothetical protein